jgi:Nitrile hydratase, alpha chain
MVLPLRPDGNDDVVEDELVPLVTRDHMIGVVR